MNAAPANLSGTEPRAARAARPVRMALWVLGIVTALCFVGPWFMADWRNEPSPDVFLGPCSRMERPDKGSAFCLLGTDGNGRDLLYRVLAGGRVSIVVGLCAAAFSLILGTAVGLVAGYAGGRTDAFLMRLVDVFYGLPRLLFALVLIAALDEPVRTFLAARLADADLAGHLGLRDAIAAVVPYSKSVVLVVCLGMVEWLTMARLVRGQVLVLREQQFIAAARCIGQSRFRILTRHILPNLHTVILTCLTLTIPVVVLDESFLSFLGLGIDEPAASWGALLKEGAAAINPIEPRWWLPVFPALAMTATLLALNFLGDSLRDSLDVH